MGHKSRKRKKTDEREGRERGDREKRAGRSESRVLSIAVNSKNGRRRRNKEKRRPERPTILAETLGERYFERSEQQKRRLRDARRRWKHQKGRIGATLHTALGQQLQRDRDALLTVYEEQIERLERFVDELEQASVTWDETHLHGGRVEQMARWLKQDQSRLQKLRQVHTDIATRYSDEVLGLEPLEDDDSDDDDEEVEEVATDTYNSSDTEDDIEAIEADAGPYDDDAHELGHVSVGDDNDNDNDIVDGVMDAMLVAVNTAPPQQAAQPVQVAQAAQHPPVQVAQPAQPAQQPQQVPKQATQQTRGKSPRRPSDSVDPIRIIPSGPPQRRARYMGMAAPR